MWRKLKSLLVMDAPEWWDQPLDKFMADQVAKADAGLTAPVAEAKTEEPEGIVAAVQSR